MAGEAVDYAYRYRDGSWLDGAGDRTLHLATADGPAENPRLFRGQVLHPVLFADALLTVGAVARSRFHVPAAMLARILILADPVATASQDRLRFESFSSCASVYARLTCSPTPSTGQLHRQRHDQRRPRGRRPGGPGRRHGHGPARPRAGPRGAGRRRGRCRHEERRVALPERWVRGFAETQAILAGMEPRLVADGAAFRRFVHALPRGAKHPVYVSVWGGELVVSHRAAEGAVMVADPDRLRVLERLAPAVRSISVHASTDGASAWCADVAEPASRWRSPPRHGEGSRARMRARCPRDAGPAARSRLASRRPSGGVPTSAPTTSRIELEAEQGEVEAALATLAAAGLVGYDVVERSYFARRLPFAGEADDRRQPRLRRARALVEAGAVRIETTSIGGGDTIAWVAGRSAEYRVRVGIGGRACTCPWWGKHPGDRGPCSHIVAVELAVAAADSAWRRDDA